MHVPEVTPDPPGAAWRAVLKLLARLPQASMSRGLGHLADLPLPRLMRRPVLSAFARAFRIDVGEAEKPLASYTSLNDFFVRKLRDGVRRWPTAEGVASPVDGIIGQVGRVTSGRIIQAKGRSYTAASLLDDPDEAQPYVDGIFVTLYLSPRHYHRIHAPVGGAIHGARHVPGALLPVNDAAVRQIDDLFARNERLSCTIVSGRGRVSVSAVGAYNVGRISTAFDPAWSGDASAPWVTNRGDELPRERRYDPPVEVHRGEEIMAFHLGSTVILLLERDRFALSRRCSPGEEVRLGELLATSTQSQRPA